MTPILPRSESTAAATLTSSPDLASLNLQPPPIPKLFGKIPKLPPDQRLLINQMLDHGQSYSHIVAEMDKLGVSLNQQNVSNWFQRGYQAYIHHQEWLDQMREVRENAGDLAPHTADLKFPQAVIHVGLCQIFQSLQKGKLDDDPVNHTRQLNALARLARTAAHLKKITDEEAVQAEANRTLSDEEIREMILDKADDILGCRAYRRKPGQPRTPLFDPPQPDASGPVAPKSDEGAIGAPKSPESGSSIALIPSSSQVPLTKEDPITQAVESVHHSNPPPLHRSTPRVRENCPYCFTLLPPRLATGERPTQECRRCHRNVHHPSMNFEACPHCDNLAPDLLPNGQRAHPDCPHCKKLLPPPPPLSPNTLP